MRRNDDVKRKKGDKHTMGDVGVMMMRLLL